MTKRIFSGSLAAWLVALAFMLAFAGAARAQDARAFTDAPLPKPDGFYKYVTDEANVIDAAMKEKLATVLNRLKERADIEFAVVTVPTTGDKDIFDYSLSIARGWGIGSKEGEKNGLLLVVAVNDRKWRVQTSRHLEGDMPDGLSGEIARQRLVPAFKQNDYGKGISDFVQAMVATLAEKRGFQLEGIDQSYAYRAPVQRTRTRTRTVGTGSGIGIGGCCLIAIVLIFLFSAFGRRGGGGRGGRGGWGGGGWLTSILVANAIGSAMRGGRQSSSGWGGFGGGGGSGWGGGGGGGGGFGGFGGGGDFGGGGSGGSW